MYIELFGNSIINIFSTWASNIDLTFDDDCLIAKVKVREYDFIVKETETGFVVEFTLYGRDYNKIETSNFKTIQEVKRYVDRQHLIEF